jgi:hypothetical protein
MKEHIDTKFPDPNGDPAGGSRSSDAVIDIFAQPTERSEVMSCEDWQALSGVDELTARRAWSLVESWLWRARRHPRLGELRWALLEQSKPTTAEVLRQRGYTLNRQEHR